MHTCRHGSYAVAGSNIVPDTAPRKKRDLAVGPIPLSTKEEQQDPAEASVRSGLSELAEFARRALEEKRRKDCLALTSAILKIDPENQDAHVMQNWIQSDLQREIQQAYALMRSARFTDSRDAVERAGLMLHDVLDIDPYNEDAKILMSRVESMLQSVPRPRIEPAPKPVPLQSNEPAPEINDDTLEQSPPKRLLYAFVVIC